MGKTLLGPINYFKKKEYIKGSVWLLVNVAALSTNFMPGLLLWLFTGWLSSKNSQAESVVAGPPTREKLYISTVDFPEADDKGMKLLKVLDAVRLSGVTKNYEGVNPQDVIATLDIGEAVFFKRVPMKNYPNATLVVDSSGDPIGWIPEDFLYQEDIAKRLDDETTVKAVVNDILGGDNGKNFGILIDIARYEKKRVTKSKNQ